MKRFVPVVMALMLTALTASSALAALIAPVIEDTQVVSSYPNDNYGGNTLMTAGVIGGVDVKYRIYLKFDLSAVPAGTTIAFSRLSLYCKLRQGAPKLTVYHADRTLSAGAVWTEYDLTWNQQPGTTTELGVTEGLTANAWNVWTLGPAAITPTDLANKTVCFQINGDVNYINNDGAFWTRHITDASLRPKLELFTAALPPYLLLLGD